MAHPVGEGSFVTPAVDGSREQHVTGHSHLVPESVVADALRAALADVGTPLTGVSCLARGADQLFARVVLEIGGALHVVRPAVDYRETKVEPDNRAEFDDLLARATAVRVLAFDTSGREAYAAANEAVLSDVDALFAVWDGRPSDARGGTADAVRAARVRGMPVTVVWPDGARRR